MKPSNKDGHSSGLEENHHDGFRLKLPRHLQMLESVPQQIDPQVMYLGLPRGWVSLLEYTAADLEGLPENHFTCAMSGAELLKMFK